MLKKGNVYAVPALHYTMESAATVKQAFDEIQPDCIAVEFAETMQLQLLHAASRLPDISAVLAYTSTNDPIYYIAEPCDPCFEALRLGLEHSLPSFCIDLDIEDYPDFFDEMPDPYAIHKIGLKAYYEAYRKNHKADVSDQDRKRELYMAKRLKELSLSYDKVLFIGGFFHIERILQEISRDQFPEFEHANRDTIEVCTVIEESCREIMREPPYITRHYEEARETNTPVDRQKLMLSLFREGSKAYQKETGCEFPGYHFRNLMKFGRNYSLINDRLMPDLYRLLTTAKACVDHNYAYEVWQIATDYPYLKNIDNLPELDLSIEEVWGESKEIQFHLLDKSRKQNFQQRRKKGKKPFHFIPPGPFSICSHQPEDLIIEGFGEFLRKKGTHLIMEEAARTVPFSTSLEDGIDTRETIRHWPEKKLYVKMQGKPPGGVGSVVLIFDEDSGEEEELRSEKFQWKVTWHGEHEQESDMAFYSTPINSHIVGPGISKCEYGGFLMTYPPRRLFDIWNDPDYSECRSKAEILLMAAIDYAVDPLITYVAAKPPRSFFKSYASRFGKKVVYLPIGQLSPITLNKIRTFHVLDGKGRRDIADEYIY